MGEEWTVLAAGIFQCIREDGQIVEIIAVVNGACEPGGRRRTGARPREVKCRGRLEGVAEDVT